MKINYKQEFLDIMAKRKLESPTTPATPPKKLPPGILKLEGTPSSLRKKIVTFPPPSELGDTLKMFSLGEGNIEEDEMAKMIGLVDTLKGQSLILWLTELQVIIHTISCIIQSRF